MNRLHTVAGTLAVVILTIPAVAAAQTRATVTGTIRDTSAALLPGAGVSLSSPALVGGTQTTTSNAAGVYRFGELLPGVYEVTVTLQNFQTVERRDIRIEFGTTATIDFALRVASVSETIVVRGSPAVDVQTAAAPNKISTEQLEGLPLLADHRSSSDVINLAPGTNLNSAYGGARQSANNLMLDGQTVNLPQSAGVNSSFVSNNWLEEVQIVGLGANAEYGEFSGIGANMVLRSGSNRLSGLADYVFARDAWVSDNRQSLSETLRTRFTPQQLIRYVDSTLQLGGPIKKDRLFFFAGFQYYHRSQLPAGALGNIPADERWPRWVGKINWAASTTVKFEGFVETDRDALTGNGSGSTNAPEALSVNEAPKVLWNGRVTWTPNSRTLLEFRNGGLGYEQRIFPTPPNSIDGPAGHRDSGTGITSVNVLTFRQLDEKRLLTSVGLTRFADDVAGKSHRFKLGLEFERTENKLYTGAPGGLQFNDLNSQPNQVVIWAGDRTDGVGHRTSFYAQDTWQPVDRLTIEPGVRISLNRGSVPDHGTVFKTHPISPRLGVAWDLAPDHRTVARASWGRYHDPNFTTFYEFMNTSTQTVRITARVLGPNNYQELTRLTPASNFGVDPNVSHSYTDHYLAGVEREMFTDFSASVQYIGMRFGNIIAFRDTGSVYVPATAPDPGPDGRLNTADDGAPIPVFSLTNPGSAFLQLTHPTGAFRRYNAFQVIAKKRYSRNWQAQLSWTYSKTEGNVNNLINENTGTGADTGTTGVFVNPNKAINNTGASSLGFPNLVNLNGTYRLPWFGGVNISGVFKYNTGGPWGRTAVITGASATPALRQGNETVRIEPRGTRYTDPLRQLDLRLEKTFPFSFGRASVYADIYNATNQGVVGGLMAVTETSGTSLGLPVIWGNPRTVQLGSSSPSDCRFDPSRARAIEGCRNAGEAGSCAWSGRVSLPSTASPAG